MKTVIKVAAFAAGLLLIFSCGSSRKVAREDVTVSVDTVAVADTFVHTHPPVVIPHRWNESL